MAKIGENVVFFEINSLFFVISRRTPAKKSGGSASIPRQNKRKQPVQDVKSNDYTFISAEMLTLHIKGRW